jgi:phosphatidyl-myo-inositol dimannoside synthase
VSGPSRRGDSPSPRPGRGTRRILFVSEVFPPQVGGSGRYAWEIYHRLPRESVAIAAGEHRDQEAFDRTHDLRVKRVPLSFRTWGLANPRGTLAYARALRSVLGLVTAERPDVLHCGRCLPEGLIGLAVKKLRGIPYVCSVHGEDLEYAATSRELSLLASRVIRGAERLIASSRNAEGIVRDGWGLSGDRLARLYPGVDTSRFVPARPDPAARDRLGWGERPVVLTVGRLQRRKGHDRMIQAIHAIRAAVPDVLYAIVGDGEERRALEEQVAGAELGRYVRFHGALDEDAMLECYQQCDLFALPNRRVGRDVEGFGIVLLEAQACGKPVIAGDSGGTAETMDIPETGRVVPCDDPRVLAALVAEMLTDRGRLARMGEAARRWAVEQFDWGRRGADAARLFGLESPQAPGGPLAEVAGR